MRKNEGQTVPMVPQKEAAAVPELKEKAAVRASQWNGDLRTQQEGNGRSCSGNFKVKLLCVSNTGQSPGKSKGAASKPKKSAKLPSIAY